MSFERSLACSVSQKVGTLHGDQSSSVRHLVSVLMDIKPDWGDLIRFNRAKRRGEPQRGTSYKNYMRLWPEKRHCLLLFLHIGQLQAVAHVNGSVYKRAFSRW
jgi:hypothetical protein